MKLRPFFTTPKGVFYNQDSIRFLRLKKDVFKGKFDLILTSPPFPLNKKKDYSNLSGEDYIKWFSKLSELWVDLLKPNGSIVIEIGNSWEKNKPFQSTVHIEALLGFLKNKKANLKLCQQFICYNPSRLPTPIEWVAKKRIRVTDSYTNIWWFSKSDNPKADNKKVLRDYSASMKSLLKSKKYNAGLRPSGHKIGEKSFLKDNSGSIAHNFFEAENIIENKESSVPNVFKFANTDSNSSFIRACKNNKIIPHPARMHPGIANFFINFLTDEDDAVLDPFAGTNITGFWAEFNKRSWVSFDIEENYSIQAKLRMTNS